MDTRLLELVTGGINPDESPESAAVREVNEETGWTTSHISSVGTYYSMPGYATQKVYLFLAYLTSLEHTALEEHELQYGLEAKEFSIYDAKHFLLQQTTHPYLKLALDVYE